MKYIDTSAFVKWYGKEPFEKGAGVIVTLMQKVCTGEVTLISSFLMVGEAISTFDKWLRIKVITVEEFNSLVSRFVTDIKELSENGFLFLETVNPAVIMSAVDYIIKYHIPVNDAMHLHSAVVWQHDIDEFICSDRLLKTAAQKEGLAVSDPEDL